MPSHYADSLRADRPDTFYVPNYTTVCSCLTALFFTHNYHRDNIRYDLLRTGSVEITSNKILERGYLDAVCKLSHLMSIPCIRAISFTASSCVLHCLFSHRGSTTTPASCYPRANHGISTNPEREPYIPIQATGPSSVFHFLT